jgi:hypothetical protein
MREPVALVVADSPAAAHGVIVRKRWNVSDLRTFSSIDLIEDRSPTLLSGGASETTEKKVENEANCEIRNMRSGDDLNRYCPNGGPKTNPKLQRFFDDRGLAGEMSGCVKPANDSGRLTGRASRELLPFGDDTSDPEEKKARNKANRELHNMISDQDLAHDG